MYVIKLDNNYVSLQIVKYYLMDCIIILVTCTSQVWRYSINCRSNIAYTSYWWYGQFVCAFNDGSKKESYTRYI